jgi:hypothetical protein
LVCPVDQTLLDFDHVDPVDLFGRNSSDRVAQAQPTDQHALRVVAQQRKVGEQTLG